MTKKDYVAIARIIKQGLKVNEKPYSSTPLNDVVNGIVVALADYCQCDNPRFDRSKFVAACGF